MEDYDLAPNTQFSARQLNSLGICAVFKEFVIASDSEAIQCQHNKGEAQDVHKCVCLGLDRHATLAVTEKIGRSP